jgi:hypothetical protein
MKKTTFLLLAALAFIQANAQKLPTVQQVSLRAPTGVKIDGRTGEWGDKFEAYNSATDLYYTIANDDKRLYFVFLSDSKNVRGITAPGAVSVSSRALINYLINGGIRINIQKNADKNDKGAPGVVFPYFKEGAGISFFLRNAGVIDKDADSVMKANNKRLNAGVKWIYTKGISGVDTELPVYNEKGIEAANAFDIRKCYICEFAIDLKHLGLSISDPSKFTYHIILNDGPRKYSLITQTLQNAPKIGKNADGSAMTEAEVDKIYNDFRNAQDPNAASSDFWGEYTLAR